MRLNNERLGPDATFSVSIQSITKHYDAQNIMPQSDSKWSSCREQKMSINVSRWMSWLRPLTFFPNPRTYIRDLLTDGMARMIFSPTIFTIPPDIVQSRRKLNRANTYTACDRRARDRWHVSLVIRTHASRFAPDFEGPSPDWAAALRHENSLISDRPDNNRIFAQLLQHSGHLHIRLDHKNPFSATWKADQIQVAGKLRGRSKGQEWTSYGGGRRLVVNYFIYLSTISSLPKWGHYCWHSRPLQP